MGFIADDTFAEHVGSFINRKRRFQSCYTCSCSLHFVVWTIPDVGLLIFTGRRRNEQEPIFQKCAISVTKLCPVCSPSIRLHLPTHSLGSIEKNSVGRKKSTDFLNHSRVQLIDCISTMVLSLYSEQVDHGQTEPDLKIQV